MFTSLLFCLLAGPQSVHKEWTVGKLKREATVIAPLSAKTTAAPLVFVWHGHGGTTRTIAITLAIHKHWPEAIVVYPQGLPTPGQLTDPEGKRNGWQAHAGDHGDRDLKFFDAMLITLRKEYKVDNNRIFSTGHSNGGGFTYLLWGQRGETFAAVAPCAAGPGSFRAAADLKPKPCLHLAGEMDPLVKFKGQQRVMNYVRKLNGCNPTGKPWRQAGAITGTYYDSKTGTPFISLIHPGKHNLPREAPELIVRFFKEVRTKSAAPQ